ncbi:MAG: phosphatidylglycerophosphatase A [Acidobacteriota bacterium]|nr:phosphatidylglycerophosphatase A [Acidobacteriota bacterium]
MTDNDSRLARVIATAGGLGDVLPAPGTTAGSLPAALLWWAGCLVVTTTSARIAMTAVALVVATAAGLWASEKEAARRGASDPGPIVIDEVAGQWLTYLVALPFLPVLASGTLAVFAAAGFLLFRLFDVVKPWPIRACEKLPGGIGIVADDLAAGYFAAFALVIGWKIFG